MPFLPAALLVPTTQVLLARVTALLLKALLTKSLLVWLLPRLVASLSELAGTTKSLLAGLRLALALLPETLLAKSLLAKSLLARPGHGRLAGACTPLPRACWPVAGHAGAIPRQRQPILTPALRCTILRAAPVPIAGIPVTFGRAGKASVCAVIGVAVVVTLEPSAQTFALLLARDPGVKTGAKARAGPFQRGHGRGFWHGQARCFLCAAATAGAARGVAGGRGLWNRQARRTAWPTEALRRGYLLLAGETLTLKALTLKTLALKALPLPCKTLPGITRLPWARVAAGVLAGALNFTVSATAL